ncbi:MAG: dynamin family protein [Ktedonobacterales bacterium]
MQPQTGLASLDVPDHLRYIQDLLDRYMIPTEQQTALRDRIQRIRQRFADPNLYLAVVGEFNSGKSTLIDALLSDALLETGSVPTTAAATYLHSGMPLDATITLRGGEQLQFSRDQDRLRAMLATIIPDASMTTTVRDLIALATTHPAFARQVARCDVTHPAPFLSDHIVIVDTPGVSSTDDEHGEVTRRVVEREADLVMVTIPIVWQISLAFESFLRETLRPFLRRAIFVITKADDLDEPDEIDRALTHIQRQIETRLEVPSPDVFVVAARTALRQSGGGASELSAEEQRWSIAFEHVRRMLAARLLRERTTAIVEQIVRLLDDLIVDLTASLDSQAHIYAAREEAIKRDTLPDYEAFFASERRTGLASITAQQPAAWNKIESALAQSQQRVEGAIKSKVYGARDIDALQHVVDADVNTLFDGEMAALAQSAASAISAVTSTGARVEDVFRQRFSAAFAVLQRIAGIHSSPSRPLTPSGNVAMPGLAGVAEAKGILTKGNEAATQATYGGATAGAIVGTFIAPGVGTLIGAGLGALFGQLFKPSLDEQKGKVWAALQPQIAQQIASVKTTCQRELDRCLALATQQFEASVTAYSSQYRTAYQSLRAQQETARRDLAHARATLGRDQAALEQRREELKRRAHTMLAPPAPLDATLIIPRRTT